MAPLARPGATHSQISVLCAPCFGASRGTAMFGYYAKRYRAGLRVGTYVTEGARGQRGVVPQVD